MLILLVIITACSKEVVKPEDINQEIWDSGIQYTIYFIELVSENQSYSSEYGELFRSFLSKFNTEELSDGDKDILNNLEVLNINYLIYNISKMKNEDTKETLGEYKLKYDDLENIFGKVNLRAEKLDENFIENEMLNYLTASLEKANSIKEKFISDSNIYFTADEVRYNMGNHLDKLFFLDGNVELCDYYNYGFTNEKSYFCGKLTPIDGKYSDSWYLYFHRDSYKELYNILITEGSRYILTASQIPKSSYRQGQGNMATAKRVMW